MTYVALAALTLGTIQFILGVHIIRSLIRQHARERDLLLNQLLNLAGRPWQPPPSEADWKIPETEEDFEDVDQVLP